MTPTLDDTLFAHAASLNLELDDDFIASILVDVKNLGVLNPKIPDAFSRAAPKTLSPKVMRGPDLPGISAFSVPIVQKYDYAGGHSSSFRAFRFLISPFEFDGRLMTLIDDVLAGGLASEVMGEIVGPSWNFCCSAIIDRINQDSQAPYVDASEKQIFWETSRNEYLIISPLADTLPLELACRLRERRKNGELFKELKWSVGGDKFVNAGVMSTICAGLLPKLMALPPASWRDVRPLPAPVGGQFLALEFDAQSFNATGSSISGGVATIPAAIGFAEALRRKLDDRDVKIETEAVGFGFSNVNFHGEWRDNGWHYSMRKGSRKTIAGKMVAYAVPELTANARVHVVVKLAEAVNPEILTTVSSVVYGLRFAGGGIFNADVTIADDLAAVMAAWGENVWMVADRQHEIDGADDKLDAALDKLDAALDKLAIVKYENGRWYPREKGYALAQVGYQGIEPPRPRKGLRDMNCRHIYASGLLSLIRWVPANQAAGDAVFWKSGWNRETYSARATAEKG